MTHKPLDEDGPWTEDHAILYQEFLWCQQINIDLALELGDLDLAFKLQRHRALNFVRMRELVEWQPEGLI